jgi:hypothetical protein
MFRCRAAFHTIQAGQKRSASGTFRDLSFCEPRCAAENETAARLQGRQRHLISISQHITPIPAFDMYGAASKSIVQNDAASALREHLRGDVNVPHDLQALQHSFSTAKPFRHVTLDDLFSNSLLDGLLAEAPRLKAEQWLQFDQDGLEQTFRMRSALEVGDAGSRFVALLHSAAFLYMLSEITGIWQLLPDPYLQGGGHALMRRGDFFNVHADRNIAYDTGLTRRLAMIVFLNKDWRSDYGGCLELWNHEGTRAEVSIEPVFNRTALFEVAYPNYHGVPQPLTCPPDRTRNSFLVYYHTVGVNQGDRVTPHSSRFAPTFYRKRKSLLLRTAEQLTPPIVKTALQRLLRRRP